MNVASLSLASLCRFSAVMWSISTGKSGNLIHSLYELINYAHRLLNYASSHPTKPATPLPWLSGPAPTPASCPNLSRAVWLAARLGLETHHPTFLTHPTPESHRQSWKDKQSLVRASRLLQSPSYLTPPHVTHNAPLHAFCQRIPVVVASVAEAEYAAAFGGGQVLVELTLTLTNLGHPQQSPPLLFVDNECAIGLATSSVRPKKSSRSTCV
jgi:hypothetical protein